MGLERETHIDTKQIKLGREKHSHSQKELDTHRDIQRVGETPPK